MLYRTILLLVFLLCIFIELIQCSFVQYPNEIISDLEKRRQQDGNIEEKPTQESFLPETIEGNDQHEKKQLLSLFRPRVESL